MRGNGLFKMLDRYVGVPLVFLLGMLRRRSAPSLPPERVLVIKLSALGDSILLIPTLRALKARYPRARVTVVCTPINEVVFRNTPYIDRLIVAKVGALARAPWGLWRLFKDEPSFDVALDFDQWTRLSPLIGYASGARWMAGFKTPGQGRHYLYDVPVAHTRARHEIDCFLDILAVLDPAKAFPAADRSLEFMVSGSDHASAQDVLARAGVAGAPFVVFHPETPAHGRQRQWPPASFVEVGKAIIDRYPGMKVVISGTRQDMEQNGVIAQQIGAGALVLPPVPFMTFAAVLSRARAMVCGNTGVMHLACALGIPLVALHGPTDPRKWGPSSPNAVCISSSLPCSPCLYLGFEYGCTENRCMRSILPVPVIAALAELLRKNQ